jgi:microcin C transport system substrate-binding protein
MERADDGLSLRFYLNPKARFADGTITAEDVRYTFDLLMTQGSLRFRTVFADVKHVEVEGPRQVRFDFSSNENRTLPLDIAACRCSPNTGGKPATSPTAAATKPRWAAARTRSARSTPAAASPSPATRLVGQGLAGQPWPVQLRSPEPGVLRRHRVARQVLRGGAYDYNREFSATGYSIGYNGPALDDGRLQRALGQRDAATGPGLVFNLQNRCSRTAACARPWPCCGISNGQPADDAQPCTSASRAFLQQSAGRHPTAGCPEELAILEPLRGQVPDEVFTQVFKARSPMAAA